MGRSGIDQRHYPIELRKAIAEYLPARGLELMGKTRWSDRLLVIVMILMTFSSRSALQDRFSEARSVCVRMYFSRRRPGRTFAGFIEKMRRHSGRLLTLIVETLRGRMRGNSGEHWRVGRFLAFGVDGTKIDCTRTRANQKKFKNGGRKKSGPQMLLVSLIHLGSGLVWGWRRTCATGSERGLLREMLEELPAGSLLVADAGFVGYDVMCAILQSGRSILMRAGANTMLLKKLGYVVREKGSMVYLWPQTARRKSALPLGVASDRAQGRAKSADEPVDGCTSEKGSLGKASEGVVRQALAGGAFVSHDEADIVAAEDAQRFAGTCGGGTGLERFRAVAVEIDALGDASGEGECAGGICPGIAAGALCDGRAGRPALCVQKAVGIDWDGPVCSPETQKVTELAAQEK